MFISFYAHWIYRPELIHPQRFTGPLPLAPALRCSAVVAEGCAMASILCSNHVTFQPSQETTALKIDVITSEC